MLIKEIMTPHVITVSQKDYTKHALEIMKANHIHHLVVVDAEEEIIGVLSERDLLKVNNVLASANAEARSGLQGLNVFNVRVATVMTPHPITLTPRQSVKEAAKLMVEKHIHSIPIVDNKKLVGIITQQDILKVVVDKDL